MAPWTTLAGRACPLPYESIDTDQLIPARFMKRTRQEGYGDALLHDRRSDPAFPLNQPRWADPAILVARRNFGGGSSREAAVYALIDAGVRCVLAPSFGDIFTANAVNNGLLPARVTEEDGERLLGLLGDGVPTLTVDLERLTVEAVGSVVPFTLDPVLRTKLLHGWDDLDLTGSHAAAIDAFAASDRAERPWAQTVRGDT